MTPKTSDGQLLALDSLDQDLLKKDFNVDQVINSLLNTLLEPIQPDQIKDNHAISEISGKLELIGIELANSMEFKSATISKNLDNLVLGLDQSLPKLSKDVAFLNYKAQNLTKSIASVQNELSSLNIDTNSSLKKSSLKKLGSDNDYTLSPAVNELRNLQLDKSKKIQQLEQLIDINHWKCFEQEILNSLTTSDFQSAVSLYQLSKGYFEKDKFILKSSEPETFSKREILLEKALTKIEVNLLPLLVSAVKTRDGQVLSSLLSHYASLGLLDKAIERFSKECLVSMLSQIKLDFESLSSDQEFNANGILELLENCFIQLVDIIENEKELLWQAFKTKVVEVLVKWVDMTFELCNPAIAVLVNLPASQFYQVHLRCYSLVQGVLAQIERIVFQMLSLLESDEEALELGPSDLEVNETSNYKLIPSSVAGHLDQLFKGFQGYLKIFTNIQLGYPEVESKFVKQEVQQLISIKAESEVLFDTLQREIDALFSEQIFYQLMNNCHRLTLGYQFPSLLKNLDFLVYSGLKEINKVAAVSKMSLNSATKSNSHLKLNLQLLTNWNHFQAQLTLFGNFKRLLAHFNKSISIFCQVFTSTKRFLNFEIQSNFTSKLIDADTPTLFDFEGSQGNFPLDLESIVSLSSIYHLNSSILNSGNLRTWANQIHSDHIELSMIELTINKLFSCNLQLASQLVNIILEPIKSQINQLGKSNVTKTHQFSLPPSKNITSVGEHLLTLPQALEAYLNDTSLGFVTDQLEFVTSITPGIQLSLVSKWKQLTTNSHVIPKEQILKEWIHFICVETMHFFHNKLIYLSQDSIKPGRDQIKIDVSYVINVMSALDVVPIQSLLILQRLISIPASTLEILNTSLPFEVKETTEIPKFKEIITSDLTVNQKLEELISHPSFEFDSSSKTTDISSILITLFIKNPKFLSNFRQQLSLLTSLTP